MLERTCEKYRTVGHLKDHLNRKVSSNKQIERHVRNKKTFIFQLMFSKRDLPFRLQWRCLKRFIEIKLRAATVSIGPTKLDV